jgi:single-strand DNA-binding protein
MSINKVILVGNVGKDPEIHYIEENLPVARFPLATSEKGYQTKDGRQIPDRTEWHNIVAWRRLAEIVEKYVNKGTQLYLEGKIRTRSYEDKDGIKRYSTEIVVDVLQLLGSRANNTASGTTENSGVNSTANTSPSSNSIPKEQSGNSDKGEDGLPF